MATISRPTLRREDHLERWNDVVVLALRGWMLYRHEPNGWHVWMHRSGVEIAAWSYEQALELALRAVVS
jgi:hypothetical protein